jgi:hypothetical protein
VFILFLSIFRKINLKMISRIIALQLLWIGILCIGCSGNENQSQNSATDQVPIESVQGRETGKISSPCLLITSEWVKGAFQISDNFNIKTEDEVLTYPTCTYTWEDGKVTRKQKIGSQEINIKLPSKIMIVMVQNASPSMFEASTNVYKQAQSVGGVGEMATWGSDMSQLSFFSKKFLFHVNVKASNDNNENRRKAYNIAQTIISKL